MTDNPDNLPDLLRDVDLKATITNEEKLDALLAKMRKGVESTVFDMGEKKGRDACRSLAAKIVKSKAPLDDAGKAVIEDAQKIVAAGNKLRKKARDEITSIAEMARKPLTDWEAEQKKIEADRDALHARIIYLGEPARGVPLDDLKTALAHLSEIVIDENNMTGKVEEALGAKSRSEAALTQAILDTEKHIADQAELDAMRASQEADAKKAADAQAKLDAAAEAQEAAAKALTDQTEALEREKAALAEQQAAAERQKVEALDGYITAVKKLASYGPDENARSIAGRIESVGQLDIPRILDDDQFAACEKKRDAIKSFLTTTRDTKAEQEAEADIEAARVKAIEEAEAAARAKAEREDRINAAVNSLEELAQIPQAAAAAAVAAIITGKVAHISIDVPPSEGE